MVAVTHPFVSAKGDGTDATLLQPSYWNQTHSFAMAATQRVAGRNTAGAGAVEEVSMTQLLDWLGTTRGSVIYRGASTWGALGPGTSGQVLTSGGAGADPSWTSVSGYTLPSQTGANGKVLTSNGTVESWQTPSSAPVSSVSGSGSGILVTPTTGAVVISNTGVTSIVAGTNISISGATGVVTINSSVAGVATDNGNNAVGTICAAGSGSVSCAAGATIAGSSLGGISVNTSGVVGVSGTTMSGTWRNIGNTSMNPTIGSLISTFQRIS